MKTIFFLFPLSFTGLFAQSRVVQRVEDYDTFIKQVHTSWSVGSKYVQYYIANEYENAPNEPPHLDTIIHSTKSLIPPVFDSVLTTITLADACTIYNFKKNKKGKFVTGINIGKERIQLLAPVYKIERKPLLIEDASAYFIQRFPNASACSAYERGSFVLCLVEAPATYISAYKKVCIVPPRIVNAQKDTIIIEEESPYLKYFEVKKIPAQTLQFWKYGMKNRSPSFLITDTIIVQEIVGKKLWRHGGWSALKYIVCCGFEPLPNATKGIQLALKAKGFYKGAIDAVLGQETKKALLAFQAANKLELGSLDTKTLKALDYEKYTPPYKAPPLPPEEVAFNANLAKHRWNNTPKLLFDHDTEVIKMLLLFGEDPLSEGFSEEKIKIAKQVK
jgi:Putative peptidoglycan binding domain